MASGTHLRYSTSSLTVGACGFIVRGCGSNVAQFRSRNIKLDDEGKVGVDSFIFIFILNVVLVWCIFIRLFVFYSSVRGRAGRATGTWVEFRFWRNGQLVGGEGLVGVDGFAIGNNFRIAVLSATLVRAVLGWPRFC
jgi:hypothetical protein